MEAAQIIDQYIVAAEILKKKAPASFKHFVTYIKPDYDMRWFHRVICEKLQLFAEGKIKKMMILVPPQHGKTELATRLFPAYLLGLNPDLRIGIASYAQTIASGFNRAIKRNIDNEKYGDIFPDTKLNYSQIFKTNADGYTRTDNKFEVIYKKGSVKTVGRGGALTSEPLDIGIIDDLYKDRAEAKSPTISEGAFEWYKDVFKTRFHNASQQLIMNTRWDEFDLAGRLLLQEADEWEVVIFKGIKTSDDYPYDKRQEGEALWPERHSLERLLNEKKTNETGFNSLYQQDPKGPNSLLVFPEVFEIPEMPDLDPVTWGMDFGYGNSYNTIVKHAHDNLNDYYDECAYEKALSEDQMVEVFKANGYKAGQVVYCDHDMELINSLRIKGINAVKAHKSIQAGLQKMKERKIYVTKRSVNAKAEAGVIRFVSFAGIITNEIEPGAKKHFWDGARYAKVGHFFQHR